MGIPSQLRFHPFHANPVVDRPSFRIQPKELQMIRKAWMFTALLLVSLATARLTAQQYGPPSSGNTSAILFVPATLNLVAGLNGEGYGGDGGPANSATTQFNFPAGLVYDSNGNLFIADSMNHVVRRIDHVTGDISTYAGQQANYGFYPATGTAPATSAQLGYTLSGLTIDSSNNIYLSDITNAVIWKITSAGIISVVAGGGTSPGTCSGSTNSIGDGCLATAATLSFPEGLAFDASGNLYIADGHSFLVREVSGTTGIISTFAGNVGDSYGAGCSADLYTTATGPWTPTQAHLCFPYGVAFDSNGNFYIADSQHNVVRIVTKSTGDISTFAGDGSGTCATAADTDGDGCPVADSILDLPAGLYVDPANRVYIADGEGSNIRMVDNLGNINLVLGNNGELQKKSIGEPDTEEIFINGSPYGSAGGIDFFTLDPNGDIIAVDSDSFAVTSAGSSGGYYFPETAIFTTSTTTSAHAFSSFYPPYILISNPSGVPLNFTETPTVTGPFGVVTGAGSGTCTFPGSLAPGATCTLIASFTPTLGNNTLNTGTISIISNAGSSPNVIYLQGLGSGSPTPGATLTPNPVPAFTSPAGVASAAQNVTLTNTGTAPLVIGSTDFDGFDPTDFENPGTNCPISPATLAPGATCNFQITFTPTAATTYSAGFQVDIEYYNTANTLVNYGFLSTSLSGTGTAAAAPAASLSPNPLAFGGQVYNTTSPPQAVLLSNTGGGALTAIVPTITGTNAGDFAIATGGANACGSSLAAGASCNIWVTFTPINSGNLQATLSVADNASPSPQTVALTGTYDYFYSNVGTALAAQPVSVYINIAATLSTINVLTQGAPNLDFTMAPGGTCAIGTAYTVGQICTVNVIFNPKAPGVRLGSVLLTDGGGDVIGTSFLPGTGQSAEIVYSTGVQTTLPSFSGGSYKGPFGITVDASLNIYVADSQNGWIIKTPWTGSAYGAPVKIPTGSTVLVQPSAVAVDGNGNVFIADTGGFEIIEVPWNGTSYGTPIVLDASGLPDPEGITVDGYGDVFFSDATDNKVVEMLWTGNGYGAPTILTAATGLHTPTGLAVDLNQNLYIADSDDNQVVELPWTNKKGYVSETVVPATNLNFPEAVAVDAAGDLYIANSNDDTVIELPFTFSSFDSQFTLPFSGLGTLNGVAIDSNGNIYVTDATNNDVVQLNLSNPPSLSFASTAVGSTSTDSPQTVTVANIGNGSLTIQSASYPANFVQNNSDKNLCLFDSGIGSGSYCDVSVNFTPTTSGSLSGAFVLTDNNLNGNDVTQSIQVSGNATGAPAPAVTLTPSLAFPNTNAASTATAMAATLSNTGNATLNITGITIAGANPSDFALSTGANACGTTLAANSTCSIYVTFTPATASSFTATLQVADNASGSPQASTLTGTGTVPPAPVAALTPAMVPFGSATAGTTSGPNQLTLSNTGNAVLNITGITIVGTNPSDFALSTGANACGTSLAADASCSIYVTFTPASAASFSATVQVADNAAGSPQTSTLTGTGTAPPAPAVTLAPSPVAFASQLIGTTSATTTVVLTNSGNATLTITGITITGTNSADFAMTTGSNACGSSVEPGATCNIYVTFTPASAASFSATLSIADNATGSPQTVALSGTGTNPADFGVTATPATQTVQSGGSKTYAVTVGSVGGTYSNPVTLTVSGLPTGATGSFSPATVTPGSEGAGSTLTVQTATTTQQTARNSAWPLAAPALAAIGLFFLPGKRRKRWISLELLLLASLGTLTALTGCGGGFNFIQPSQSYTLTITGTNGNDTHSTTVQLTVE
jgi:sugar lactone lactonase YvrE